YLPCCASELNSRTMICKDDKFDKYVLRAAREIGEPTYCAITLTGIASIDVKHGGINCQQWVQLVLEKAKKEYLADNPKCPECFKK
ncbi:MAG: hypothetical protein ACREHG_05130, partial [Candidatus Saccharimonadales bacterium]